MVLSSLLRVHPVHAVTAETALVSADLWTKPIGLNHKPACRELVDYTHHHRLLLLLSPKADTHFIVPRRVEG